jgi:hypothetical protein
VLGFLNTLINVIIEKAEGYILKRRNKQRDGPLYREECPQNLKNAIQSVREEKHCYN